MTWHNIIQKNLWSTLINKISKIYLLRVLNNNYSYNSNNNNNNNNTTNSNNNNNKARKDQQISLAWVSNNNLVLFKIHQLKSFKIPNRAISKATILLLGNFQVVKSIHHNKALMICHLLNRLDLIKVQLHHLKTKHKMFEITFNN